MILREVKHSLRISPDWSGSIPDGGTDVFLVQRTSLTSSLGILRVLTENVFMVYKAEW